MNSENLCELCEKAAAVTGVRDVRLCKDCFYAIANKQDNDRFIKFSKLADSRAELASKRAIEREQHLKDTQVVIEIAERTRAKGESTSWYNAFLAGAAGGAVAGWLFAHSGGKLGLAGFVVFVIFLLGIKPASRKAVAVVSFIIIGLLAAWSFGHRI